MYLKQNKKKIIIALTMLLVSLAFDAKGAVVGDIVSFNVDKNFDASARTQISAVLVRVTTKLYFYVEKNWWDGQPQLKQSEVLAKLDSLAGEFEDRIYPNLTSAFGSEVSPGLDNDKRITVLLQSMNSAEGGYFREADEYARLEVPISNEREMVYISVNTIDSQFLKSVLAHEFMHLISFNQKVKTFGIQEETWLEEARADYSSTILGYDDNYQASNLQSRVQDFVQNPSDSLTEWRGGRSDYAATSLFFHYLVDHYGINVLIDSLKSKYVGIESLNYALKKVGFKDDFSVIFTNWTVAVVLNNCDKDQKYCYLNTNLKNFKLAPGLNFLPLSGSSSLSVTNVTKNWTGNWLKFIGGNGDLELKFSGLKGLIYQLPYIVEDASGNNQIKFLSLTEDQQGEITIDNFGKDVKSLIIIPSLQSQVYKVDDLEPTYPYTYSIKITGGESPDNQSLIQQLLDKIASLKAQIAQLLQGGTVLETSCSAITADLYYGLKDNAQVRCLQTFLKNQGADIYPSGYVSGNFLDLTRQAVIKFQEKYAADILTPIGMSFGSGYVGPRTRAKINQMLSAS